MRRLVIEIDCGSESCSRKAGQWCKYVRTSHFGSRYHCQIFGSRLRDSGWIMRCPECLAYEQTREK